MVLIEFKNIAKEFPGVVALNDVSFSIEKGSCHALMGENGAGKSTLGKILAGIYRADSGEILLQQKPIAPADPLQARRFGAGAAEPAEQLHEISFRQATRDRHQPVGNTG